MFDIELNHYHNENTAKRIDINSQAASGSLNGDQHESKCPDASEIESPDEMDFISIKSLSENDYSGNGSNKTIDNNNLNQDSQAPAIPELNQDNLKIENIVVTNSGEINVGDKTITHVDGTVIYNRVHLPPTNVSNDHKQSNEIVTTSKCKYQKIFSLIVLMIIIGILSISILLAGFTISNDLDTENPVAVFEEETLPGDKSVIIVPKTRWITQVDGRRLNDVKIPAPNVIIAHTASSNCSTRVDCISVVRSIQEHECNFFVGGDGAIYEGSGWYKAGKLFKKGYLNARSICIAFIGNYNSNMPSAQQIEVVKKMIAWGVKENKLQENYTLYAQCQLIPTDSPGATLIDEIKNWDKYFHCKKKSQAFQNGSSVQRNRNDHLCC